MKLRLPNVSIAPQTLFAILAIRFSPVCRVLAQLDIPSHKSQKGDQVPLAACHHSRDAPARLRLWGESEPLYNPSSSRRSGIAFGEKVRAIPAAIARLSFTSTRGADGSPEVPDVRRSSRRAHELIGQNLANLGYHMPIKTRTRPIASAPEMTYGTGYTLLQ